MLFNIYNYIRGKITRYKQRRLLDKLLKCGIKLLENMDDRDKTKNSIDYLNNINIKKKARALINRLLIVEITGYIEETMDTKYIIIILVDIKGDKYKMDLYPRKYFEYIKFEKINN